ncbi:integrin alpha-IIb isoform X2 [Brachyhypopomus gauderio]|uniref:integrin alpha-IIb isoform X2 n=1 Tax=Brachyhypopomus gauderio TaxID=698409 RepID=UPI0040424834
MLTTLLLGRTEGARDGLLLLALCLPACLLPLQGSCFNLDLTNHTEFSGPEGSYFGFSLDFYQSSTGTFSVVVGAPRNDIGTSQGGAVFLCPWTPTTGPCDKLGFDHSGDQNITFNNMLLTTHKTNQWLGGTVRVHGTSILACAPMFHWNVITAKDEAMNTPVGNCQLLNMLTGEVANYAPCRGIKVESSYKGRDDWRYCEAGFSSDITEDGRVILGAPGGFFFQGQIITAPLQSIRSSGRIFSPKHRVMGETTSYEQRGNYDFYLGYSVATGQLDADKSIDYAVGVPNDLDTAGSVKIYSHTRAHLKVIMTLKGFQVASYFGHCVAVTDINSDGKDDILVGSPLFMENLSTDRLREVGQVYIYLQTEDHKFSPRPEQTLTGVRVYGHFGIAVAPLGDIDHDGFRDVAVGAPGSGEGGLVFIFMGQSGGLNPQYTQVIVSPFKPPRPEHAFGFSMRGGTDIDGNGYPDLIVGAWGADRVAVYRTKAVVRTKAQLSFFPDILNPDDRFCQLDSGLLVSCFNIMMCINVSGNAIPEEIVLNIDLQLDTLKSAMAKRTLLLESAQPHTRFQVSINRDTGTLCRNLTAYLLAEFKDKLNPIIISLHYSLATVHHALLRGQSEVVAQTEIILDCGSDNICIPDLKLAATAAAEALLIGAHNPAVLLVTAENRGESAYETELHVHLPAHTYYQGAQSDGESSGLLQCVPRKENGSVIVVCELGNPMKAGQKIQAGLSFSVGGLEDVETHVSFHLQIKRVSSPIECVLPISKWEPKADPERLDDVGPLVEHVYELRNKGASPVNVRLQLRFPVQHNGSRLLYVFANASEETFSCRTDHSDIDLLGLLEPEPTNSTVIPSHHVNKRDIQQQEDHTGQNHAETVHVNCSNTEECLLVTCEAEGLASNDRAIVRVAARLWVHTFLQTPYVNYVLRSTAYYEAVDAPSKIQPKVLPSGHAEAHTSVVWMPPGGQARVPIWWIAISFFAGLLLLAMLIIIFWKLGFFKRHRPPTDAGADDTTTELNAGRPDAGQPDAGQPD